jgi:hypothetical protein
MSLLRACFISEANSSQVREEVITKWEQIFPQDLGAAQRQSLTTDLGQYKLTQMSPVITHQLMNFDFEEPA